MWNHQLCCSVCPLNMNISRKRHVLVKGSDAILQTQLVLVYICHVAWLWGLTCLFAAVEIMNLNQTSAQLMEISHDVISFFCIYTGCFIHITKELFIFTDNTYLRLKTGLCVEVGLKARLIFLIVHVSVLGLELWICSIWFWTISRSFHTVFGFFSLCETSLAPTFKMSIFISVPMWKYIFTILNE